MILAAEGIEVVGEAADGAQAIDAVRRTRPDVVLMDIRMPEIDGLEATRRILSGTGTGTAPRIIILTTYDLDRYVYAALNAGASGFLLKDVSPEHLVAAVRLVRSGDALLAPTITRRLIERFAPHDDQAATPRSSSSRPVGWDWAVRTSTSPIGRAGVATVVAVTTRGGAAGAPASPTVPQVWHSPHRPTHLEVCQPHSEQRKAGAFVVFAMQRSVRAGTDVSGAGIGARETSASPEARKDFRDPR
jgi:CheY-like chemotaxis protein